MLDNLDVDQSQINNLIAEANYAFRLNMYMFEEIQGKAALAGWALLKSYLNDFAQEMILSKRFR